MTLSNLEKDFQNKSCFDFLPEVPARSVNLILIDPPYEISRDTNFQNGALTGTDTDRFRISMDFGDWDKNFTNLEVVFQEAQRILVDGGTMICFYDLWKIETIKKYYENNKFKQIRFIEWLKTNPVPINSKINYLTNAREVAVLGIKKSKPTFNSSYDNGIYNFPICHDKGRFHPTQKPLELMEALVLKHSKEQDVVLDCFAGSGTTAVAALKNNRKFIGCEANNDYYVKAIERVKRDIVAK